MNPYQLLYYSQFELIWYINCNFKLLFKNKGIFLLKYRGTSKSKLGSHRKVQWYESYNSKNSAFLTLIKETSLVISLRSSYIIYAVPIVKTILIPTIVSGTSLPSYQSLSITAYYSMFLSWPMWKLHQYFQYTMNTSQLLYYYQVWIHFLSQL